jgi:excisionase family DNA binding protein
MVDAHCARCGHGWRIALRLPMAIDRAIAILRGAVAAGCPKCEAFGADVLAGPAPAGALPEPQPAPERQAARPDRFDDLPDMCTPEQAGGFLQLSRNAVYELIKAGDVPSVKFGRLIRIPKRHLLEHAASAQTQKRPARSSAAGRKPKPKP